ncbi:TipC family immunity protein [Streptococcus dentapri]|uniref:TipC family immunity protein n=1 Tax=Streptococcus dentapri TaxID=573564 RepID=A0ABV8D2L6_9STRE
MKRRYKILLSFLLILLFIGFIALAVLNYQTRQKSTNIFDEIYYTETSPFVNFSRFGQTRLGTKKDVVTIKRAKNSEGIEAVEAANFVENYQNLSKPTSSIQLAFFVPPKSLYKNGYLTINIGYQMKDGNTIDVLYGYSPNKKILKRQVVQNYWRDGYSEKKSTVLQTLSANHLHLADVYSYSDNILREKVLKDWCSIYNSHYSPSHWGKVKVVNTWESAKEE